VIVDFFSFFCQKGDVCIDVPLLVRIFLEKEGNRELWKLRFSFAVSKLKMLKIVSVL
jgi:hypothetical protein